MRDGGYRETNRIYSAYEFPPIRGPCGASLGRYVTGGLGIEIAN
jgi:hypothetical protein